MDAVMEALNRGLQQFKNDLDAMGTDEFVKFAKDAGIIFETHCSTSDSASVGFKRSADIAKGFDFHGDLKASVFVTETHASESQLAAA
jgi:hypothetical protein